MMVIVGIVSLLVVAGAVGVALWFRNKQIQLKTGWKISYDDLNFQTDRAGNAFGVSLRDKLKKKIKISKCSRPSLMFIKSIR